MNEYDYEIPNDDTVTSDDIVPAADLGAANLSGANLRGADLSEANLLNADLSGADLFEIDLSGAGLRMSNLSGAELSGANLSGANLGVADLSGAELTTADLSEVDLTGADLSEANLIKADLSKAVLTETTLRNVKLARSTDIDTPGKQIKRSFQSYNSGAPKERRYDVIARANHELREAYSGNGLVSQARTARIRERRARRREAKAQGGWQGTFDWAGSLLSRVVTGYGVRLRSVVGVMMILYFGATLVYWHWGGMSWDSSLYYSVVTFTTAPPETPPRGFSSIVAGIETFAGTTAIVFLGYILSARERV